LRLGAGFAAGWRAGSGVAGGVGAGVDHIGGVDCSGGLTGGVSGIGSHMPGPPLRSNARLMSKSSGLKNESFTGDIDGICVARTRKAMVD
jgi:hypothetical protein